MGPLLTGGMAILFIAIGATLMYMWIQGAGLELTFLATDTPTYTPSPTPTMTASAPFNYLVESGDTLVLIAEKFGVDYLTIMVLNGLTNDSVLFVGDQLVIPNPGMEFPTPTPLPPNLGRGAKVQYFVMPGDSIKLIAEKMLSTIDGIIDENDLEDPNAIFPGQILIVPYRLITPTFGPSPTPEGFIATETPAPTFTETSTPTS
jgi:LysM repeat protein